MSLCNRNNCKPEFDKATPIPKPKPPPPFSIRFSWDERDRLERESGKLSLAAHIRRKLFGDYVVPRKLTRKRPQPEVDYVMLGQILGLLGKSELASSLCLLATAARSGSLPVTEEVEDEIKTACGHVDEMRVLLIQALGIKDR